MPVRRRAKGYTGSMESLQNLLKGRGATEPPEIKLIKDYVQTEFKEAVEVMVRDKDIVIIGSSSALVNTLRLRTPDIQKLCNTNKRLTFRIN